MRSGNPAWLWPEIEPAEWQRALRGIERAAREILTMGRATRPLTAAAPALSVAALTSGMGPLLGYWLDHGLLDAETAVAEVLELHYRHNRQRMEGLAVHAVEATEQLAARGILVTVLKGMQTAFACFPDPGTRPLADIDLLIAPADKDAAGHALRSLGYQAGRSFPVPPQQAWSLPDVGELPRSLSLIHRDNPWTIDLQTSLNRRYSNGAPVMKLDALRSSLEPWPLAPAAQVLQPAALVLHLACHASCGLENLTMVRLAELVMAVRDSRFEWEEFRVLAGATDTLASAYPALRLAEQLVPGTVEPQILGIAERQAPAAVRRVVGCLRPANAQRVLRCSLEERFMWTPSLGRAVGQALRDLAPREASPADWIRIYRQRLWRLARGRLTRTASQVF